MYPTKNLFLLATAAIFLISCNDDEVEQPTPVEPQMTLNFSPYFNGSELGIAERFVNVHGYPVEVTDLTFYVSNIQVHDGDVITDLSEIEIINVRNAETTLTFMLPIGNYDAVSFDLGVPQDLNGTANPDFLTSVYDPTHPLSESNGMYWIWQTGYRFCKFEGRYDTVSTTAPSLPLTFALHSGRDTLFRTLDPFPVAMTAGDGAVYDLDFAVDIDKVFLNGSDSLNLKYENSFHGSLSNLDVGIKFANNSAAAFRLLP
jgi:hypothetical protein